ncbi:major facilitator superfamily domain-containing protein [Talaromyces proteolyticus]|uniref:Major facilitator superfamily domain-containing protein n=1 Tax=Talaromyces proteolyticus TaxID=1131652 RepID=A0AAD4PXJ3_9EURO|nr:major facilitator superfamily domain-containing protein [Talaromyces proteolyticus]KAH8693196.1 major facilitator superfamily domain-containing protein [Talaromyces proteolyticus]
MFVFTQDYSLQLRHQHSRGGNNDNSRSSQTKSDDVESLGRIRTMNRTRTAPWNLCLQRTKSIPIKPQKTSDGIVLVDWYATDDLDNPQNWSGSKKCLVAFLLCFYTWTVYWVGPIYNTAEGGIQEHFGVSPVASSLGLSLYVLAYGIGDLLFPPLCEIPVIGRNPIYYLTFIIFWILSFPEVVVDSFANGGATVGDMLSVIYIPFGFSGWGFSAFAGPAFGSLTGGFAAQAKGWRWPMWEITSPSNILLRRARRLRMLQSQSEINQHHMKAFDILLTTLVKPIEIMMKDPSIFFVNVYTSYFYGVFYVFFEVFPLVFPTGLAFLACLVGAVIALGSYLAYLHFYMVPDNIKNGLREQEHRLFPTIIVAIFVMGQFVIFQALFMYIPLSYPQYTASLFAGNSIWRSGVACGTILFARPLFVNLGTLRGVTVLGDLTVMGILGTIAMSVFGKKLRARSKFAQN